MARAAVRTLDLPDARDQALSIDVLGGGGGQELAVVTELGYLCRWDLRAGGGAEGARPAAFGRLSRDLEATSVATRPKSEEEVFVSLGPQVRAYDWRRLDTSADDDAAAAVRVVAESASGEDVNHVALHQDGTFLAAGDDEGEVQVVSLKEGKVFKHLKRGGHTSICSSVAFRPRQPWELVSGGLDCNVLVWDFSRGKTRLALDAASAAPMKETDSQVFNPPMVHAVAVPSCRDLANHIAAARGDAKIALYDISGKGAKALQRTYLLDDLCEGHSASVGHVTFARYCGERRLVSGGNDGKVVLWNWRECTVAWSHKHGKKINWTATTEGAQDNIVVADTSSHLSLYSGHC